MSIRRDLTIQSVRSREVLVLALAGLECAVLGVVGSVVSTTDAIEDVFTVVFSIRSGGIASLETEEVITDEVVPLNDLVGSPSEYVAVHHTSHGIPAEVGTVGVHLASGIVSKDVDGSLVDESDSLDIIRSPHKLHALQGTSRN